MSVLLLLSSPAYQTLTLKLLHHFIQHNYFPSILHFPPDTYIHREAHFKCQAILTFTFNETLGVQYTTPKGYL